jgi:hypothetical protein
MTTRRTFLTQTAGATVALVAAKTAIAAAATAGDTLSVDPVLLKRATVLLEQAPLIDTHNDLPSMLIDESAGDLTKFNLGRYPGAQGGQSRSAVLVNLRRIRDPADARCIASGATRI